MTIEKATKAATTSSDASALQPSGEKAKKNNEMDMPTYEIFLAVGTAFALYSVGVPLATTYKAFEMTGGDKVVSAAVLAGTTYVTHKTGLWIFNNWMGGADSVEKEEDTRRKA